MAAAAFAAAPQSSLGCAGAPPAAWRGFLVGEFASNAQQPTEAFARGEPYRGCVPSSPFSVRDKPLGRRQAALFLGPAEYPCALRENHLLCRRSYEVAALKLIWQQFD